MGKLQTFAVNFDNPLATYRPNKTVSGHVDLVLSEPMKMRGVRLKIVGLAYVSWSEGTGDDKKSYSGREVYLKEKTTLCETDETSQTLAAGSYRFPFSVVLPNEIPSSYEGNTGLVRYSVEANVDKPWKFDTRVRAVFTVIRDLDLNTQSPEFREPTALNEVKDVGCHGLCCCFCCCTSGTVSVALQLSKRCFVPGETIFICGEVINRSETAVKKTTATLKQVTEFIAAHSPEHVSTASKTTRLWNVCKVDQSDRVEPGRSGVWNNVALVVPSIPPSKLEGCNIINISYRLEFCCTMDFYSDVYEHIDVLIGTIPLHDTRVYHQPVITTQPTAGSIMLPESSYPILPSYEDCVSGKVSVRTVKDPEHMQGDLLWAPKYPVYRQLSSPTAPEF